MKFESECHFSCLAGGYPTPTYEWFREDFENDRLVARKIDPLSDIRYTISGGAFIIHNPEQVKKTNYKINQNTYKNFLSEKTVVPTTAKRPTNSDRSFPKAFN